MDTLLHERAGKWPDMLQHPTQVIDGAKVHRLPRIIQQRELAVIQPDSRQIKAAFQRQKLQLEYLAIRGPLG
jgi:hypothetical protein